MYTLTPVTNSVMPTMVAAPDRTHRREEQHRHDNPKQWRHASYDIDDVIEDTDERPQ